LPFDFAQDKLRINSVEGPVEPLVVSLPNQALPFDWLRGIMAPRMNRYFAIGARLRPMVNAGAETRHFHILGRGTLRARLRFAPLARCCNMPSVEFSVKQTSWVKGICPVNGVCDFCYERIS
jgi:hypothetical protein